ncbi:TlpA disulfide reductase family protein [Pseudodesulfovibrio thermohalotolerans]|uniref:TlpA disulfide reductase family protein n=1 Tax=Pseudodesulfovibrio thermohalotolerans TaxID=2880651 RepID=UPI0022B9D8B5|nr:TlpA disulfide reductase family protein [Pseudodesulfovibrio thermohalotolerans]WFS63280.1 TlpA disulfide reductase family protein [Pseudodesulfovibrio thermohalotolerans]
MKKHIFTLAACLILTAALVPAASAADLFPDLALQGKISPEHREYLGAPEGDIKISDIGADFAFVEVLSMYCPICQHDAPGVNDMFARTQASDKADRVRFVGIAAGNTPFEVAFYRKKFDVQFPLFEDPEYVAHKALNNVGTPAYYLVDLRDGKRTILIFHEGEIKDKGAFLKTVLDTMEK